MKLLAIETATDACSAALLVDETIETRHVLAPREHARLIIPMIDELMREAGLTPTQLDAVAFGRGPGAFTGLRIAAGVTQGVAFAAGLPVVAVSTLAAMAQDVMDESAETRVIAALDARMGEVYWGAFAADTGGYACPLIDESVSAPETVPLPEGDETWFAAGSAWSVYAGVLDQRLEGRIGGRDAAQLPHARGIARLGAKMLSEGGGVRADQAQPVYLRDRVAEPPKGVANKAD